MKKSPSPVEPGTPRRVGTVALVGRPNVGKSTLLNALVGQKIAATTHKPQTTRRQLRGFVTTDRAQIVFVDTPGLMSPKHDLDKFMVSESLEAARGVDLIAVVVEASRRDDAGVDPRDLEVLTSVKQAGAAAPMVLLINKIDILDDKKTLLPLIKVWSESETFAAIVPVSAVGRGGTDAIVDVLAQNLPEGELIVPEDSVTDASERDISAEIVREKAMLELQDEIPYRVAVVVEEFDEARRDDPVKPLVRISAVLHVERESQKRIVVGKGGERIKAIGQRARKDLERLLDAQVMLSLFVRVEPGWTESDKALNKLGYRR